MDDRWFWYEVRVCQYFDSLIREGFLIGALVRLNYTCRRRLRTSNVNVCRGEKTKGGNVECFGPPAEVGHRSQGCGWVARAGGTMRA